MCISVEKYGFLFNNMEVGSLLSISRSLPYKMEHITKVFKYLGYFIKPFRYKVKDWFWLVQNLKGESNTRLISASHWEIDKF